MTFYQRACRYLWRKRSKSLLLFFIFLFANTMILGTGMILHAAQHTQAELQKKTKAKAVCEMTGADAEVAEEEYKKMKELPHVQTVNRMGNHKAFLTKLMTVTNSDSAQLDNFAVNLYSYDEIYRDSPFSDHTYQITEGRLFEEDEIYQAIVNADFAALNGLHIGDTFFLQAEKNKSAQIKVTVCGLFLSGTEHQQEDETLSAFRVENHIYLDQTAYRELFGGKGVYKISVYTDRPGELSALAEELQSIFLEEAEVTTSDTLFQQMKAPLTQITRVVRLMQVLSFLTGLFVISLLLCMWMRSRQKEMAVFLSMGEKKILLFLQAFMESAILFLLAVGCSCTLGTVMAEQIQKLLLASVAADLTLTVTLTGKDMIQLLGMGGSVVLIAVMLSILPVIRSNPKDILSRMEG